jgi:hypothetical protein
MVSRSVRFDVDTTAGAVPTVTARLPMPIAPRRSPRYTHLGRSRVIRARDPPDMTNLHRGRLITMVRARLRMLDERLVSDAAEWGIRPNLARILLIVPLAAGLALAALLPFKAPFAWLTSEDGIIEWLQVVALVVGGLLFASLALELFRAGRRPAGILFVVLAAMALFVAGEEISWGQRIFGWLTPANLEAVNHQGETNIHNIRPIQRAFNLIQLVAGLYGVAVPILWASGLRPRLMQAVDRFVFVPPLCLASFFLLPFGYRLFRSVLLPEAGERITTYGELPELALYAGAALFAGYAVRVLVEVRRRRTVPNRITA